MNCRNENEFLPEFSAELKAVRENGISTDLLYKIIQKHLPNSIYNRKLYNRYRNVLGAVPIHNRQPKYEEENPINNKVSNDFFGEIVDFKVGYFAGDPISYSYSSTEEAEDTIGGEEALDKAKKTLTDFTTRNNMFGTDMEATKNASIYGYSGRLFYIDKEGNERVMPVHGYETIILSDTDISEPECAIRYYKIKNLEGAESWVVDFYDDKNIYEYTGDLLSLTLTRVREHCFDYCPLQGIANNRECIGDAEKVLSLIDDYDKVLSDNSNEVEAFVHAMMIIGVNIDDDRVRMAQKSGVMVIPQVGSNPVTEPVKWVTKNINDSFTEHHLERLEDNIYRFSKTPNLNDDAFGTASGVSLKFKLHGLETKCSAFEASMMNSAQYMWKVLCSSWKKKGIEADPLQFCMEFSRNFPLDKLTEAQTAQAFISAGLPKEWVYSQISGVDDVDYIMGLLEDEKDNVTSFYSDNTNVDSDTDKATNAELNEALTGKEKISLLNGAQVSAFMNIVKEYNEGSISRNAAITTAVSTLGISRENAEAIIEEKIAAKMR